jgi:hypothetical protein
MKKTALWGICIVFFCIASAPIAPSYSTKAGKVKLGFDLTVGQMEASTNKASSTLDLQSEAVLFNMKIAGFEFSNPILEQQFKETYMEVDKYPETTFIGKIKEKVNFGNKLPQKVTVIGTLGMHGVTKPKVISAVLTVLSATQIKVLSDFKIKASDHKIDIPAVFFNEGKDEIKVNIDAIYTKDK